MNSNYIVKTNGNASEMSKPNSTMLVYKVAYSDLEKGDIGFILPNNFIVYILYGKNNHGKDMIYVGKSKNGIKNRPTAHKDKCRKWTTCYILTQFFERTFFNDGTIQYLEDTLNHRVNETGIYENTTQTTTSGTANRDDIQYCDEYLQEAYKMLNILGLDLYTNSEEDNAESDIEGERGVTTTKVPNGIYYFSRKLKRLNGISLKGKMRVDNNKYILLAGSDVALEAGIGLSPNVDKLRNSADVRNGKLMEDIIMYSPSACGEFIIGSSCNGWTNWFNDKNEMIDIYRKK